MVWFWIGIAVFITSAAAFAVSFAHMFFRTAVVRQGMKRKHSGDDAFSLQFSKYMPLFNEGMEWFKSQNPETVSMVSFDGLKLYGSLLPCKNARRTVLCMHGWRGGSIRDFSCILCFYHEQGCNLLLPDQRAHGESEGKYICFGVKERFDCRDWAQYIYERFGSDLPIYLDGISMGAATVLMASGLQLPENVCGIIADCGFTSPRDIFVHVVKSYFHLPAFPVVNLVGLFCKRQAGFDISDASTIKAMRQNQIPTIFIHGDKDKFVPCLMSRQNADACAAEKSIDIIPGARHGESYLIDTERCQKKLVEFFDFAEANMKTAAAKHSDFIR